MKTLLILLISGMVEINKINASQVVTFKPKLLVSKVIVKFSCFDS